MAKKQKLCILASALLVALAIAPQAAFADEEAVAVGCGDALRANVETQVEEQASEQADDRTELGDAAGSADAAGTAETFPYESGADNTCSDDAAVETATAASSDSVADAGEAETVQAVAVAANMQGESEQTKPQASDDAGPAPASAVEMKAAVPASVPEAAVAPSPSGESALATQAPSLAVSEGAYVIKPKTAYGSALSVAGSRSAGAVGTAGIDGDYDQIFYFQPNGSGLFAIFSSFSGLALDASGSDVRHASYSGSNHQLFEVRALGNGYALVSKAGRALVVSGSALKTGAYDKNAAAQRFLLVEAPLVIPGTQVLYAAGAPASSLGVAGSSRSSGTVASSSSYAGQEGQKMTIVRSSSGYAVKPVSSGMGFAPSGDDVIQKASSSYAWTIKFASKGARRGLSFLAPGTGKALQVSGSSVKLAAQNGSTAQAFLPAKVGLVSNGCYVIKNLAGSIVLEVEAGNWANGSNVSLYASNGTGAQMFDIKDIGSGLFQIANAMTGHAVSADKANVYQYSYQGAYYQLWVPVASPSGGMMWVNAATGKVLNAAGTSNGANATTVAPGNAKAQSWSLSSGSYESDPVLQTAMWHVNNSSSATSYQIMVDRHNCRTVVAEKSGGVWRPIFNWTCSPGAPSTPTVGGDYTVTGWGYSFNGALGGTPYTCYYYTQFWGDYLFHSVPYYQGTWTVQDGRLGQMLSHGCVRLATENAKWLYDNIPYATHVYIYN